MPFWPVERKRLRSVSDYTSAGHCSCIFTFSLCRSFRRELIYTRSTLAVVVLKLQSRRKAYRTQDGVAVVTTQQLLFILRTIGPQQNTERNTDEIPGQHILLFYLKFYYHLTFYFKTHILLNIDVALVSHVFPFDTLTNPLPYISLIGLLRVQHCYCLILEKASCHANLNSLYTWCIFPCDVKTERKNLSIIRGSTVSVRSALVRPQHIHSFTSSCTTSVLLRMEFEA